MADTAAGRGRGRSRNRGRGGGGGGQQQNQKQGRDGKNDDQKKQQQRKGSKKGNKKDLAHLDAIAAASAALGALDAEATRIVLIDAMAIEKDRAAAFSAAKDALDAWNEAEMIVEDWKKQQIHRDAMRKKNAEAPTLRKQFAANKKKLKSDLKRTTAFVKKVKAGITDDQRVSMLSDTENLNLSLYISELVPALAESRKTKDKDVATIVDICSALHQRYDDFGPALFSELLACCKNVQDEKKPTRAAARLAIELCCVGVFEINQLDSIMSKLQLSIDAALFASILKPIATDILGIIPNRVNFAAIRYGNTDIISTIPIPQPDLWTKINTQCDEAYNNLLDRLQTEHKALRSLEKRCTREAINAGGLTEAKEKALEDARKARDKLLLNLTAAADCLKRTPPVLPGEEDIEDDDETTENKKQNSGGISLYSADASEKTNKGAGAFDDEAARSFYEDYPNVLDTIPAAVLGLSEDELTQRKIDRETQLALWKGATLTELRLAGGAAALTGINKTEDEENTAAQLLDDIEEEQTSTALNITPLTKLLTEELPACLSREIADDIAIRFCEGMGAKLKARKRLVKVLAMAPRMQLDLVPYLSRVAAIVSLPYRDITELLVSAIYGDFLRLCRRSKSSPNTLEARLKNVRFLAELLMFRVAPPRTAFSCLHRCLDDFTNHNVDVACALLEHAGGFLLRSPRTAERATRVFEIMLGMKKAPKPLGSREAALVDSAYYHCFPAKPDTNFAKKKPRSQLYQYLEYLLIRVLCEKPNASDNEDLVDNVIRALRQLPWYSSSAKKDTALQNEQEDAELPEDEETIPLVVKHFLKLARHRADAAAIAADALSGLHKYHPIVSSRVVDAILEAIELALETPASRRPTSTNQRLVSMVRFYGELYNFSIVTTQQFFSTLQHILNHGHFVSEETRSMADALASYEDDAVVAKDAGELGAVAEEEEEDDDDEDTKDTKNEADDDEKKNESPYSNYSRRVKYAISEHATHDPRVPCAIDEPGDFLRVTLSCTMLRTAAPCIIAVSSARGPLELFVDELQRYFYTKPVAALGPRYAILDTIDDLERGAKAIEKRAAARTKKKNKDIGSNKPAFFVRNGWYEAHDAVEAGITANAAIKAVKARLKATKTGVLEGAQVEQDDEDVGQEEVEQDDDEDDEQIDEDDDDEEDDDDDEDEDDDNDDDEDEEEEDDDEDEEEEIDEDYEARIPPQQSPEDAEFDLAFNAMIADSMIKSRAAPTDTATKSADNMAVPAVAKRIATNADTPPPPGGFKFQVLRRGAKGRLEARELVVPEDSTLATQVQRNEEEQRREHSILKRNILMQARNLRD